MIRLSTKAQQRTRKVTELDKLLAVHIKNRDGWRCVNCNSDRFPQAMHVLGKKRHPRLRYEPLNIYTGCAKCHLEWHDGDSGWFDKKFPGVRDRLIVADRCAPKVDLDLLLCVWRKEANAT